MKLPAQSPAQTILCRRERGRTRSQTALETRGRDQLLHPPSATVMGFFLNLLFFRLCLVLGCFISSQAAEAVCGLHFLDFFCPLHTPQPCALLSLLRCARLLCFFFLLCGYKGFSPLAYSRRFHRGGEHPLRSLCRSAEQAWSLSPGRRRRMMRHLSCLPCPPGSLSPSLSPLKRVLGGVCMG